jgi:DNA-binding response OmpR family regulator
MADARPLVLIVDDEPEILGLISEHLAPAYRTRTALNGVDALTAVRLERPDVALLDINMPLMSGIELQREIRRIDATIPVIMLTAVQDVRLLALALENGAFGYLPKPYHPVYLEHLLAAALSGRH